MAAKVINRHLGVEDAIEGVVRIVGGEPVALMGIHGNGIAINQLEEGDDGLGATGMALLLVRENTLEIIGMRHAPLEALFAAEEDSPASDHVAELLLVADIVGPGFGMFGVEARPGGLAKTVSMK